MDLRNDSSDQSTEDSHHAWKNVVQSGDGGSSNQSLQVTKRQAEVKNRQSIPHLDRDIDCVLHEENEHNSTLSVNDVMYAQARPAKTPYPPNSNGHVTMSSKNHEDDSGKTASEIRQRENRQDEMVLRNANIPCHNSQMTEKYKSSTSANQDAHILTLDITHQLRRGNRISTKQDLSNKPDEIDERNGAFSNQKESPKQNTEHKLTYGSDGEYNIRKASLKTSRVQSPLRFLRSPSPLFSPNTQIHASSQPASSIQVTSQSEISASARTEDGLDQGGRDGGDNEASYQRDESSGTSRGEDSKESSKITKSQVLTFFSLAISIFLDQVSFSVLAPFFPREAKDKGVSSLQIGFIFGAFALINFIFSPIFGKFLPRLGAKFTFVSGVWIVAGCNILFGFCDDISSTSMFIIFCYVIRSTAAVGTAGATTASFTIAAQTFPDHVAQTVGLMETFGGLGFMVGPVIGGFLYEIGGNDYKIPFIVLGCADMVCVVLNLFLLPSVGSEDTNTGSMSSFLSIPSVWPVGLSIFVLTASYGFLDPTLSLHVQQFTQSAMVVGLLFLIGGACYALGSPFWGWLAEKLDISRLMIIIGSIMSGVAFLLLGPSPLLNLPSQLWIVILSMLLSGLSISSSIICSFNDFLIAASKHGMPDDMGTQAIISGVFSSLLSLGNFVGPSVGGAVVHLYGFDWSVTIIAGIQVAVAIIVALFTMGEFCYYQRRRSSALSTRVMASVNQEDSIQDSMEPLLKGRV